jgi:phosphoglycerate dehydrogenase-like enzyme
VHRGYQPELEVIEVRQLPLVVTFEVNERGRATIAEALCGAADVIYLADVDGSARPGVLSYAGALLVRNTANELRPDELALIRKARLVQFISAGIDFIPLHDFPQEVPMASNGGAYAEPMAEHALAMALAAAKRLFVEHENLSRGQFNQFTSNKMLAGGVCGVFGFGGVGIATARLMRCVGMRIHAINRRGATEQPVDWIGEPDRLDELLAASDVLVISAPLTRSTERVIGARELSLMKGDAIMVNLARGEIVDGSHCTRTCEPIFGSPPASTRGGWNPSGTASFEWINHSSNYRTSLALRTTQRRLALLTRSRYDARSQIAAGP